MEAGDAFSRDLRELNMSILNSQRVRDLVAVHLPFEEDIAESYIAALVAHPSHYGVVRMFQGVTGDMLKNLRAFHDIDEARQCMLNYFVDGKSVGIDPLL